MSLPVVGHTFAHYRILSHVGSGGMGVVYEAEDVRAPRRRQVPPGFAPLKGHPRFERLVKMK